MQSDNDLEHCSQEAPRGGTVPIGRLHLRGIPWLPASSWDHDYLLKLLRTDDVPACHPQKNWMRRHCEILNFAISGSKKQNAAVEKNQLRPAAVI